MNIAEHAARLGMETCRKFDPSLLVPEERVRGYCRQNLCATYGRNYMCPPYVGGLAEIQQKLRGYNLAWLLQRTVHLDAKNDIQGLLCSRLDFHRAVLEMEKTTAATGAVAPWGLIGSSCGLCDTCTVLKGKPCPHPTEARPSLEALAVDVRKLLQNLGLELAFHDDRVTWTGCILAGSAR